MRVTAYKLPVRLAHGQGFVYTYVDPVDFEWARHLRLHEVLGYARSETNKYLHRLVLNAPKGMQVDHIDRDKLNNRRSNLRLVTIAQQRHNQPANRGSSSAYRGVCAHQGKWMARVQLNGAQHYIGVYDDEQDAGEAARAFRLEHMSHAID